jgi:predicted Zn-ribbon and HTH transcriptional regulator
LSVTKPKESARKVMAWIWECHCSRCGHEWYAFHRPTWCAGCKSRWWDKPRVRARKAVAQREG